MAAFKRRKLDAETEAPQAWDEAGGAAEWLDLVRPPVGEEQRLAPLNAASDHQDARRQRLDRREQHGIGGAERQRVAGAV